MMNSCDFASCKVDKSTQDASSFVDFELFPAQAQPLLQILSECGVGGP